MNSYQTPYDTTAAPGVACPPFQAHPDRRHGARSPLVLEVLVYHRHVPVGRARTRDVSLKGACVETHRRLTFEGHIVQVKLSIGEAGEVRHVFLNARVAYQSERTLGLRFLGFDHDVFDRALQALSGSRGEEASDCSTDADEPGQPLNAVPPSAVAFAVNQPRRFIGLPAAVSSGAPPSAA